MVCVVCVRERVLVSKIFELVGGWTLLLGKLELVGGWREGIGYYDASLSTIPSLMVNAAGRCDTYVPPKARKAVASLI